MSCPRKCKFMENERYKILLVEDDKLDQMAFERLTKSENLPYDYKTASSVSDAQGILKFERFDVVISDYLLGDGTAFDILDSVGNIPIILVTGTGDEEIAIKAWKAGACDYLIKDPDRNYIKTLPITVDNAIKHKRTEEKLQLLSRAVMSTDDSVYITDIQNKIIFVNRAFCETYGYDEQEIIGKDSNALFSQDFEDTNTKEASEAFGQHVETYHRRKDGSEFPVSVSTSVIKGENGNTTALIGVARDITQRVFTEDKIRAINMKLGRGNRIIG